MSFFDIINDINEKKQMSWEDAKPEYNAWMINRGLSNHMQTVFFANEMNRLSLLDNDMQFSFYQNGITKSKRFGKWHKKEIESKRIEMLSEYFCINKQQANEYMKLLSEEQLLQLEQKMSRGGSK